MKEALTGRACAMGMAWTTWTGLADDLSGLPEAGERWRLEK